MKMLGRGSEVNFGKVTCATWLSISGKDQNSLLKYTLQLESIAFTLPIAFDYNNCISIK